MASVKGRQVRWYDPLTGRQRSKTCSTPQDAKRFAARQIDEARLYGDGYLDADQLLDSRQRVEPISKVLALFKADLDKRQVTEKHRSNTLWLLQRAIDGMGAQVVRDLALERVSRWMQGLITKGLSASTHNSYRAALSDLCGWCVLHGYLPRSPMSGIRRLDVSKDRRRVSRALTVAEVDRLTRWGGGTVVTQRRRALYLFRIRTGLRALEASRLVWGDFDLDAQVINLRAEVTKNGKPDCVPLSADVIEALIYLQLRAFKAGRPIHPGVSVFGPVPDHVTWKKHCQAAGVELKTGEGFAEQKGLRHTCSSFLLRSGVSPMDALMVLRHRPPAGMALTLGTYGDLTAILKRKRDAVAQVSEWMDRQRTSAQEVQA